MKGAKKMKIKSTLITFGREVITGNWPVSTSIGVNRLYYIHKGNVSFLIGDVKYALKTGYLYLLPQNIEFKPVLNKNNYIDHSYFDFFSVPEIHLDNFLEIKASDYPIINKVLDFCFEITDKHKCIGINDDYFYLAENALNALLTAASLNFKFIAKYDDRLDNVLQYIYTHYLEDIPLDTLADMAYISKNYFIKIFKDSTSLSPYQFIKKLRLNYAVSLIRNNVSVTEVSEKIGYENVSAFSNAMKKTYGIYPSQINKKISIVDIFDK